MNINNSSEYFIFIKDAKGFELKKIIRQIIERAKKKKTFIYSKLNELLILKVNINNLYQVSSV